MEPVDILARITDHDGDTVFDRLADWPAWLPSTLTWLLIGLALTAVALAAVHVTTAPSYS